MRIYRIAQLHSSIPLTPDQIQEVISDVRTLYPEAERIAVAGTYARANETPSTKKTHDVDVLIFIPKGIDPWPIVWRDDSSLWRKWDNIPIDFIMKYGDKPEWMVGQHRDRIEQGLATPEVNIWP